MKRALWMLAAGLVAGGTAISQELAPEVLLLSRVKQHTAEELKALPNISCLETVHRDQKAATGRMQPLDTVRLEVLSDGHKEQFASPGDRNFSDQPPISYAGSGTLGDGFFGLYLRTVLVGGNVSYSYKGDMERGGRRLAQWDYRLPLQFSGQTFHLQQGSGRVSLQGSFFADAKTYDVTRLTVEAGDFPPTLPVNEAHWSIDYARTSLGRGRAALLPESAEFRMVMFSGEATHQRFGFTQCRIFGAQSTITFDAADTVEDQARFGSAAIDDTLRTLPGGLHIAVKLISRIAGDATVGALIEGVVADEVRIKGAPRIAPGARVRGRIRRLERYTEPVPHFIVALEFTEVELNGLRYRFDADFNHTEGGRVEQTLSIEKAEGTMAGSPYRVNTTRETLEAGELPGVAVFFFRGGQLNLAEGLRTIWTTRLATPKN